LSRRRLPHAVAQMDVVAPQHDQSFEQEGGKIF
jgi:hypothetical protein